MFVRLLVRPLARLSRPRAFRTNEIIINHTQSKRRNSGACLLAAQTIGPKVRELAAAAESLPRRLCLLASLGLCLPADRVAQSFGLLLARSLARLQASQTGSAARFGRSLARPICKPTQTRRAIDDWPSLSVVCSALARARERESARHANCARPRARVKLLSVGDVVTLCLRSRLERRRELSTLLFNWAARSLA